MISTWACPMNSALKNMISAAKIRIAMPPSHIVAPWRLLNPKNLKMKSCQLKYHSGKAIPFCSARMSVFKKLAWKRCPACGRLLRKTVWVHPEMPPSSVTAQRPWWLCLEIKRSPWVVKSWPLSVPRHLMASICAMFWWHPFGRSPNVWPKRASAKRMSICLKSMKPSADPLPP